MFRKYAKYIYHDSEYQVATLDGKALKEACCNAAHSVAGMDHFSPQDFTVLGDMTYDWIAKLFNSIEQGHHGQRIY